MAKKLERTHPSDKTAPVDKLLDYWNVVPDTLGDVGLTEAQKWNPELDRNGILYMTFTDKVMALPEKLINGKGEEMIILRNKCFIDIFRIPLLEKPTLNNILRIAFANGRLMTNARAGDFPEGLLKAYKDLAIHQLINFVEEKDWHPDITHVQLNELYLSLKKRLLEEIRNVSPVHEE